MKDRFEQEIEQILRNLDSQSPEEGADQPAANPPATPLDDQPSPFAPRPPATKRLISPSKLSMLGVALAIIGLLLKPLIWLSLAGVVVIALAVAWMFLRRATGANRQVWRGREIEAPPQTAWERFRNWLSR
jgi:hypothetical protein